MAARRRSGRKILLAFLPVAILLIAAVIASAGWMVYRVVHPPRRPYLVTPDKFSLLSDRSLRATSETWTNRDGTRARGWLLRGGEGNPGIVLLHRYGADRSWLLNLGVKLNETTNYTVLWPDLRGHGEDPPVGWTSFGAAEAEDTLAALDYLRSLKTPRGRQLLGTQFGIYGAELGAEAALAAAAQDPQARALVLDSVPASPDELLHAVVGERVGLNNVAVQWLVRYGVRVYFLGHYNNLASCASAGRLEGRQILLLSGADAGYLHESTVQLAACFPSTATVQQKTDLALTGMNLPSATGEQEESYDRQVIDFFGKALR